MDLIQEELQAELPFEVGDLQPPFATDIPFNDKFKITYRELQRTIRLKNRLLSLINAYYLGKLLNELETTTKRFQYKRKLSNHYARMSENVFDIFEHKPTKILVTSTLTVQTIRKISRPQILQLREFLINNIAS
jgi:hypothetical protein